MVKLTDKEVLKKAIEIATKKGSITAGNYKTRIEEHSNGHYSSRVVCMMVCFSHDFAKAFWYEPALMAEYTLLIKKEDVVLKGLGIELWQYHLSLMVLEENPIDYLRKFIK